MDLKKLFIGAFCFLFAQSLSWYQSNGQFISSWIKDNPVIVALVFGIPVGLGYIYGTTYIVEAFEGKLWSARLLGFATGVFSFTILTYFHLKEGITIKTATILALAAVIVCLQVFWKE